MKGPQPAGDEEQKIIIRIKKAGSNAGSTELFLFFNPESERLQPILMSIKDLTVRATLSFTINQYVAWSVFIVRSHVIPRYKRVIKRLAF